YFFSFCEPIFLLNFYFNFLWFTLRRILIRLFPTSGMIRIHYFSHPSTYENESSHSCTFSMIRSFADLERLFSLNSSSFATIALRLINLNGASVPSGKTGRLRGTGLFVLHLRNAFLQIRSSNE